MSSLYDILEVSKSSDSAEIKKAFIKLAKTHHPDKGGNTEVFKKMVHAYEVLCDDKLRSIYDATGRDPTDQEVSSSGGGGGAPPVNFPFDIGNIFSMFGGAQSTGGPMGMGGFGGFGGFGMSASVPTRRPKAGKPPPKVETLNVNLGQLYFGSTISANMDRTKKCKECSGSGAKQKNKCTSCNGSGSMNKAIQMGPVVMHSVCPCVLCGGRGFVIVENCMKCSGSGKIRENITYPVRIEQGALDGDTVVLSEVCSEMDEFEKCGDLVLSLKQTTEGVWKRAGSRSEHLETAVEISLAESLVGCTLCLKSHPAFKDGLFVKIPPVSVERDILRIPELGMPIKGISGRRGDVNIHISVAHVSVEDRELLISQHGVELEKTFGKRRRDVKGHDAPGVRIFDATLIR